MNLKIIEKLTKISQNKEGDIPTGKQIITNMECSEYDIKAIREVINSKGRILKTQCVIFHHSYGNILVNESRKHLKERIEELKKDNIVVIKGFQQTNKNEKKNSNNRLNEIK